MKQKCGRLHFCLAGQPAANLNFRVNPIQQLFIACMEEEEYMDGVVHSLIEYIALLSLQIAPHMDESCKVNSSHWGRRCLNS